MKQSLDSLHTHYYIQVFQDAPIAFCLLEGDDFLLSYANPLMLETMGRTSEMIVGKPVFELFPEIVAQGFQTLAIQSFQTGAVHKTDEITAEIYRYGKLVKLYVKLSFIPVRNFQDKVTHLAVIGEDVTQNKADLRYAEFNEKRFHLAIEESEIASFEYHHQDGRLEYTPMLNSIFGLEWNQKMQIDDFVKRIFVEDRPKSKEAYATALESGKLNCEARLVKPDGNLGWFRCRAILTFDDNIPSSLYGIVTDITQEKQHTVQLETLLKENSKNLDQTQRKLLASELRFQRMTDEVEDYAILVLDMNGQIMNWNKGAQKIKGYKEEEVLGRHFRIFYTLEDQIQKLPEQILQQAFFQGRASVEGYRVRKDGTQFWGNTVISAIHNTEGSVIGYTKVTRDLSERKLAEDKLKEYTRELELQNRELEQFAYIASHDLQEPLRKIRLFSGMMASNLDKPEQAKGYLNRIENSAKRMSELIQSVLNYSRLLHYNEDEFTEVSLQAIVQDILNDFDLLIEEKNAQVECETLPSLYGNTLQMHQLFYNLIGNALKFSSEHPKIRLAARITTLPESLKTDSLVSQNYYEIVVSDNGIGFEQKYADQIFTIFKRLNSISDYQGTGIGLALCKKIVNNHKGVIWARSELGKGSSFYIYLPLKTDTQ